MSVLIILFQYTMSIPGREIFASGEQAGRKIYRFCIKCPQKTPPGLPEQPEGVELGGAKSGFHNGVAFMIHTAPAVEAFGESR